MENRLATLKCKEVVNICDGCRLGYVCDVELDLISGRIIALLLPRPCRFFGLFGRRHDYRIPWGSIKRIGSDIILVDVELAKVCVPRGRRDWP